MLCFEAQASFTGEKTVEIQCHGSLAVTSLLLEALSRIGGLRLAEEGEFTRRALENGRLDLAQVEGLADLIDAETAAQHRQAIGVMRGALSKRVGEWRRDLVRGMALIEVTIDFADEEVPTDVYPEVHAMVTRLREGLARELEGARAAERIRDGFEVAIIGRPNVGKSTLLNAIAKRDAAITSASPGTTRDVIEVRMDIGGLPVTVLDTAGLRETADAVEQIGVARAVERADRADLRVFLLEPDQVDIDDDIGWRKGDLVRRGKADTADGDISGVTGEGVSELLNAIEATLAVRAGKASSVIRQRHITSMRRAEVALDAAQDLLERGDEAHDLIAEDLRAAAAALGSVIGMVGNEAILDEIFSSFCLGK